MAATVDSHTLAVAELLAQLTLDHTEAAVSCPAALGPAVAGFQLFLLGQRFDVLVADPAPTPPSG